MNDNISKVLCWGIGVAGFVALSIWAPDVLVGILLAVVIGLGLLSL